jgi:biopolymer transport protein ExbB
MLATLIQYSKDSWGLIPLMALVFIAGVAVIIERAVYLSTAVKNGLSLEYDLLHVARGNLDDTAKVADHYGATVQGELVKTALQVKGQPVDTVERSLDETIMFQLPKLDRNLWVLDTCVTLGPLMGLLGTIIHMIEAFSALAASGTPNAQSVTGPIAHALVATAIGLCIAITAVVPLNYFNKRIRLVINQFDLIKSMLVSRLGA